MLYGIVQQNEGFIDVKSEPGQGATFDIYLPRYTGMQEWGGYATENDSFCGGHETVLLVEDEEAILTMVCRMLEMFGYSVLTATTPGEALQLVEKHGVEIKLLMTDVVMPEMNGWDLAGHVLNENPNMRCLFMSGYTADEVAHRGVSDQVVNFIQKPFSQRDLASMVRNALDGGVN